MGSGTGWSAGLARTLALWWQAWRKQARSERRPPEALVDRKLAEAALARADVDSAPAHVRSDMSWMMRHFGVDPARIAPSFGAALLGGERICANCPVVGRCQRWLYGQLTDDAPRLFCPNAQRYEDIAINQKRDELNSDD
jgi:hypothetical protein